MGKLYTKNDLSKLMNIPYKALRGYEDKELISPTYINKQNGYKYYDENQIFIIDMIRYSNQNLDISLNEIKELIGPKNNSKDIKQHLINKKEEAKAIIKKYQKIVENIERSLSISIKNEELLKSYITQENGNFYYFLVDKPYDFATSKKTVMKVCQQINNNTLPTVLKKETHYHKMGIFLNNDELLTTQNMMCDQIDGNFICLKYYDYEKNTEKAMNIIKDYAKKNHLNIDENKHYYFFQALDISTVTFQDFLIEIKIKIS